MGHRFLVLSLAVSAAFNIGLIGTSVYRNREATKNPTDCVSAHVTPNPQFKACAERLQIDLKQLRHRQAEETRRLAELIHARDPDQTEIDVSLDRLAAAGRAVHARVVETILEQRETLPEDQRAAFCNLVQRRLCDPWAEDMPAACSAMEHHHKPPTDGGIQ